MNAEQRFVWFLGGCLFMAIVGGAFVTWKW